MANSNAPTKRPLSPHLQVFRPLVTMMMSIVHRLTGMALYAGTLLVVWWLLAAAAGPADFDTAAGFFGSWIGRLVLFGYTWALMHHMLGGVRHFVWDTGYGFDLPTANAMAWGTLAGSVTLTMVIWIVGYLML